MGEAAVTLVARVNLADAPAQLKALKDQILEVGDASFTAGEKQAISAARSATQVDRLISRHNAEANALDNLKTKVEGTSEEYGRFTDKVAAWLAGDATKETEQWASAIDRVGEAASGASGFMGTFGAQLVGQGGIVAGGFLAAQAIGALSSSIHAVVSEGASEEAKLDAMRATMKGLGRSASEAERLVNDYAGAYATDGAIANAVTNLSTINLAWWQQRAIIDSTTKLAVMRSEDVGHALDRVTEAIESGETRSLKRMGIIVDSAQAEKDYAHALGITGRQLDQQEKQYAIADAALRKTEALVQAAPADHETLANKLEEEKVAWDKLEESIGRSEGVLGVAASAWATFMTKFWLALTPPSDEAKKVLDAVTVGPRGTEHLNLPSLSGNDGAFNPILNPTGFDALRAHREHEAAQERIRTLAAEKAEKARADAEAAHTRALKAHIAPHHAAAHHAAHHAHEINWASEESHVEQAMRDAGRAETDRIKGLVAGHSPTDRLAVSETELHALQSKQGFGPPLPELQGQLNAALEAVKTYGNEARAEQLRQGQEKLHIADQIAHQMASLGQNEWDQRRAAEESRFQQQMSDIRNRAGAAHDLAQSAEKLHQQKLTKIDQDETTKRVAEISNIAKGNVAGIGSMATDALSSILPSGLAAVLPASAITQAVTAGIGLIEANSAAVVAQMSADFTYSQTLMQGEDQALQIQQRAPGYSDEASAAFLSASQTQAKADSDAASLNHDWISQLLGSLTGGNQMVEQEKENAQVQMQAAQLQAQAAEEAYQAAQIWQQYYNTNADTQASDAISTEMNKVRDQMTLGQVSNYTGSMDLAHLTFDKSMQSDVTNLRNQFGHLIYGNATPDENWNTGMDNVLNQAIKDFQGGMNIDQTWDELVNDKNVDVRNTGLDKSMLQTLKADYGNNDSALKEAIDKIMMNGSSVNKPLYAQVVNFHDMWATAPAGIFFRASGQQISSVSLASGSNITPGGGNLGSSNPARTVGR